MASALAGIARRRRAPRAPVGPKATLAIASHSGIVRLSVEVARTPQQRDRGLKFRRSLGRGAGMVFVFGRPTSASFWMKDTLIPLSVAFYDGRGASSDPRDGPCRRDPCRVYTPGVAYRGAVEANRGGFARSTSAPATSSRCTGRGPSAQRITANRGAWFPQSQAAHAKLLAR